MSPRGPVWRHYQKDPVSKKAVCNICGARFSCNSTTKNLKCHLRRKHPELFEAVTLENETLLSSQTSYASTMWDCYEKDPASGKAVCNICKEKFSYKSTITNLKTHLRRRHISMYISLGFGDENDVSSEQTVRESVPVSSSSPRKPRNPNVSAMWQYFEKEDPDSGKAVCKICSEKFSYKSTTSNLKCHLKRKHPHEYAALGFEDEDKMRQSGTFSGTSSFQNAITSTMWQYYEKDPESGKAVCSVCQEQISYKSTTANLKSHLRRKHAQIYATLGLDAEVQPGSEHITSSSQSVDGSVQPVHVVYIEDSNEVCQPIKFHTIIEPKRPGREQKLIDLDFLDLCVDGFHPPSIVEERAFKKFVRWIPGFKLPTKRALSSSLLQELYTKTEQAVRAQVAQDAPESLCITTDVWTSGETNSYIAVTGHYITNDFEFKTVLLGCCHLPSIHTAADIVIEMGALLDQWGLRAIVNFAVSESAANMVVGIKEGLGWQQFDCFGHTLNSIFENALEFTQREVDKVRRIIAYFAESVTATEKLELQQIKRKKDPKRFPRDIGPGWNATYCMLKAFIELQNEVQVTLALMDKDLPVITKEEWILLAQLLQVLRPFEELISSTRGEKYLSGSSVIVMVRCFQGWCNKILEQDGFESSIYDTVNMLKTGLAAHFECIEHNSALALCTFMDPRFKMDSFSDENEAAKTKESVKRLVASMIEENEHDSSATIAIDDDDKLNPWNIFQQMMSKNSTISKSTPLSRASKEVDMFLSDDLLEREDAAGEWNCPIEWWKSHRNMYPNLAKVFTKHCNIVATSVPCERIFAHTELMFNERRTRLSVSKIDKLMFLRANLNEDRFKKYM